MTRTPAEPPIAAVLGWRERGSNGVRLVCNRNSLVLSTADRPERALARADTRGQATAAWELTMYVTSFPGVRIWQSPLGEEQLGS
ncbi:hypothetical protein [Streptomyces sp. NPDC002758]